MRKVNRTELERMLKEKIPFKAKVSKNIWEYIYSFYPEVSKPVGHDDRTIMVYYLCVSTLGWDRLSTTQHHAPYNVEEIEVDFSEEKLIFNSQQEVWEYLIAGGKVYNRYEEKNKEELNFYFKNGTLTSKKYPEATHIDFPTYQDIRKYIEPEKKEWYEEIPEQGILCSVVDVFNHKVKTPLLIRRYNKDTEYFEGTNRTNYLVATPLKATNAIINGVPTPIFKEPKTDDGLKKSAKGYLMVAKEGDTYKLWDNVDSKQEQHGCLETVLKMVS